MGMMGRDLVKVVHPMQQPCWPVQQPCWLVQQPHWPVQQASVVKSSIPALTPRPGIVHNGISGCAIGVKYLLISMKTGSSLKTRN